MGCRGPSRVQNTALGEGHKEVGRKNISIHYEGGWPTAPMLVPRPQISNFTSFPKEDCRIRGTEVSDD